MPVIRGDIRFTLIHQIRIVEHIGSHVKFFISGTALAHAARHEMGKQSLRIISDRSLQIRILVIIILCVKHGLPCFRRLVCRAGKRGDKAEQQGGANHGQKPFAPGNKAAKTG